MIIKRDDEWGKRCELFDYGDTLAIESWLRNSRQWAGATCVCGCITCNPRFDETEPGIVFFYPVVVHHWINSLPMASSSLQPFCCSRRQMSTRQVDLLANRDGCFLFLFCFSSIFLLCLGIYVVRKQHLSSVRGNIAVWCCWSLPLVDVIFSFNLTFRIFSFPLF